MRHTRGVLRVQPSGATLNTTARRVHEAPEINFCQALSADVALMSETAMPNATDIAIIGGGIVGLATGLELITRFPGLSVAVVEKESTVGAHQTKHNSGVIHSGVYY